MPPAVIPSGRGQTCLSPVHANAETLARYDGDNVSVIME